MLQLVKSLSKLEKVLIVAFLVLGFFFIRKELTKPVESAQSVKIIPTYIYVKDGVKHEQAPETTYTQKQMKDSTKLDKKRLHANEIESETTIVDTIDSSYKNGKGMSLPDDTISIKRYDTRKWFLAPLEHKIDVTHSDTAIYSKAASSLSYKTPKVLFVIGPYIGYDLLDKKPSIGVSITFNLFSIKSKS